jgi:hypothetical protein
MHIDGHLLLKSIALMPSLDLLTSYKIEFGRSPIGLRFLVEQIVLSQDAYNVKQTH